MRRFAIAVVLTAAFLCGMQAASVANPAAQHSIGFGGTEGVIELKQILEPSRPPPGAKQDASQWYTFTAVNGSNRPAIRVLHAGQQPGIGLSVLPRSTRPAILQVVSTDPNVVIEGVSAYTRNELRV
jgi:hypothetical protein